MIGTILNLMLTHGLTMKRWNNFPRVEEISHLDNMGFVMHVALFLAHLEEENGQVIDKEFLLKRILFGSLSRLIISDINTGTKEYMLEIDSSIFAQLEAKALDVILKGDAPDEIKEEIISVIGNTDKTQELLLINAAKKFAGHRECLINSRVYLEVYEKTLEKIALDLEKMRTDVYSLDVLLKNNDYIKYLSHIRGLSHSLRWNQNRRLFPVSVMAHLAYVTMINYFIGAFEKIDGKEIDMESLLLRSIYHDIPEAITGDIITPTKRAIPGFVETLEKAERQMMEDYLFGYLPESYKSEIEELIFAPFDGKLGEIAKYGDIFSALFEAKLEVNSGNNGFLEMYRSIKNKANTFPLTGTKYLVTHAMDDFDAETGRSL